MLDLTAELTERLLVQLNQRQALRDWQALLSGEDYERHRALEREHYDTTFSQLHRNLRDYVEAQLQTLYSSFRGLERPPGVELLGHWLACVDTFSLASTNAEDSEWVRAHVGRRPLSAFRIGESIFFLSGRGRAQWLRRKYEGLDTDPILRLRYQRKYDHERHGAADGHLRAYSERLWVASDLLALLGERVTDIDISAGFEWPQLEDIQTELAELGLVLFVDTLASFGGNFGLELCALAPPSVESFFAPAAEDSEQPQIDFTIIDGRYRGALGGYHRRPSGMLRASLSAASSKWMLEKALTQLRSRLRVIVVADREQSQS